MSLGEQSLQFFPVSARVSVLRARGLRIKGKDGTNDAYAALQAGRETFRTPVAEKRAEPAWGGDDAAFIFTLPPGEDGVPLQVRVLHRVPLGADKLLGLSVINVHELRQNGARENPQWFKLLNKTGKADKERGEVLLDIQFLKSSMSVSMIDLSDKSHSRLGKFKDKLRGKKKEGLSDSASAILPSVSQVLTDSEGEMDGETEGESTKKKKNKLKSLFVPKSNMKRNSLSQSLSSLGTLPDRNSSISSSTSSGLNVEPSEGKKKKKFTFLSHKRNSSSDSKASNHNDLTLGSTNQNPPSQVDIFVNGSQVYREETQSEEVQELEEEEEEEEDGERWRREEEEQERLEEEGRREAEEERKRKEKEEQRRKEEEEKEWTRREREKEEQRRRMEEEERERVRAEREKEEHRRKMEEEEEERERMRMEREEEEEKARIRTEREMKEQRRRMEAEEKEIIRIEREKEEQRRKSEEEEKERIRMAREEEEQSRRMDEEEKEKMRLEREVEEQRRRREVEEKERRRKEREEKEKQRRMEEGEQERKRMEKEEQRRKFEEEERTRVLREQEEQMRKLEEERKRKEERQAEELRRKTDEENDRKKVEEEKKKRITEEERLKEEKKRAEREEEEKQKRKIETERRLADEKKAREEEERRIAEAKERQLKEEERVRDEKERKRAELEKNRKEEEQRRNREVEEQKKKEKQTREEQERLRKEENLFEEGAISQSADFTRSARISNVKPSVSVSGTFSRPTMANTNPFLGDDLSADISGNLTGVEEATVKKGRAPLPPQLVGPGVSSKDVPTQHSYLKEVSKRSAPQPPGVLKMTREVTVEDNTHQAGLGQGAKKTPEKHHESKVLSVSQDDTQVHTNPFTCDEPLAAKPNKRPAPKPRIGISVPEDKPTNDGKTLIEGNVLIEEKSSASNSKGLVIPNRKLLRADDLSRREEPLKDIVLPDSAKLNSPSRVEWDSCPEPLICGDDGLPSMESSQKKSHAPLPPTKPKRTGDPSTPHQQPCLPNKPNLEQPQKNHCNKTDQDNALLSDDEIPTVSTPSSSSTFGPLAEKSQVLKPRVTESVGTGSGSGSRTLPWAKVVLGDAGEVREQVAPTSVIRQHAVKPLSAAENLLETYDFRVTESAQPKTKAAEAVTKGPYSQLTQPELISLALRQQEQISQRDARIQELEQYIDNLLVRVMEEKPSILMTLNMKNKSM